MAHIAAVHGVVPSHRYSQQEITDAFGAACSGVDRRILERIHAAAGVQTRHLALPLAEYDGVTGFGAANNAFIRVALELGAAAVTGALAEADLSPADVDLILFTSVTGIAAPSIDARLVGRIGFRPNVKRLPIFGLGCVAGAAGVARLHDYLHARPDGVAVLLSVELCSLTIQRGDVSTSNVVAGALFGDGAAAVVAVGQPRVTGPEVVATRSQLYPDTEHVMGWDIGEHGFGIVLSADVPAVVRDNLGRNVRDFLADHDLVTDDITAWICHPGGPRVLDAVRDALEIPAAALDVTRRSLAAFGNLSSSSVLHVLRDTLRDPPPAGSWGLLMALGPGFCAEFVLLRW